MAQLKSTFSLHPSAALEQKLHQVGSTWSKVLRHLLPMPVSHKVQANNAGLNLLVIIVSLWPRSGVQALSAHSSRWMDTPVNQRGLGRGKHFQTYPLGHESKNREIHKNCLQSNCSHKYFISKLVVLAGVKHAGTFKTSKAYVRNGRSQMQLARRSAEGVRANRNKRKY